MAKNKIDLINRALVSIGANPIQGLEENTSEALVLKDTYNGIRDGLLSSYQWRFAIKNARLQLISEDTDGTYQFGLPADCLRILDVDANGYEVRNGILKTQTQIVEIRYIFRPEEEDFPAYFDNVLVSRIAAETCLPLTDSTTRTDFLFGRFEKEFKQARLIDASQEVNGNLNLNILTDVRL
ncbi:MAG: hypothetical protein ACPG8V_04905 [Alphaproteobacteria bacterium]